MRVQDRIKEKKINVFFSRKERETCKDLAGLKAINFEVASDRKLELGVF